MLSQTGLYPTVIPRHVIGWSVKSPTLRDVGALSLSSWVLEPKEALLIQVERHIADGRELIAQHRKILVSLALSGADTGVAVSILRTLLESQRLHEKHHRQLLIKLAREKKR